ncbi:hypothetical protein L210DRAFT_791048, partial [Boletus edulis BED1]
EHGLGGNSKERIACPWRHCHSRPMQRQSLIRHVSSVHVPLMAWTCPQCSRTFSRSGTAHR